MKDIFNHLNEENPITELNSSSFLVAGGIATVLTYVIGLQFFSALGIGLTIFLFFRLLIQMNRTLPVLEIMLTMAAFQWIIGPIIDYKTEATHYKYYMHVGELEYMRIVVPSLIAFTFATLINTKNLVIDLKGIAKFSKANPSLPYYLIAAGILFDILKSFVPGSLKFVFFLLGNLKYIGIIMLLFSEKKNKWIILGIAVLFSFLSSIRNAMFHDFLLWGIMFFCVVSIVIQMKLHTKLILFVLGVAGLIVLQGIKQSFREQVWDEGYQGNKLSLFIDLSSNEDVAGDISDDETLNTINARLNQGWIISSIIERYQTLPFEGGSTVKEAITASLLPRFLNPNKRGGGGRYAFELLTGLELGQGVAMGTSLMGEFYGNYGLKGTIISFLLWGAFLNLFYRFIVGKQEKFPTIMIFLPIIFLQVVKAESDLLTVLNHLVKSTILVAIIFYVSRKTFNISF